MGCWVIYIVGPPRHGRCRGGSVERYRPLFPQLGARQTHSLPPVPMGPVGGLPEAAIPKTPRLRPRARRVRAEGTAPGRRLRRRRVEGPVSATAAAAACAAVEVEAGGLYQPRLPTATARMERGVGGRCAAAAAMEEAVFMGGRAATAAYAAAAVGHREKREALRLLPASLWSVLRRRVGEFLAESRRGGDCIDGCSERLWGGCGGGVGRRRRRWLPQWRLCGRCHGHERPRW